MLNLLVRRLPLPAFEGLLTPIRSLIQMIRRSQLEPADIPVAALAGRLSSYVNSLPAVDPDIIGGFLGPASDLVLLKSRQLTPWHDESTESYEPIAVSDFAHSPGLYAGAVGFLGTKLAQGSEGFARTDLLPHPIENGEVTPLPPELLASALERQIKDMSVRATRRVPPPIFLRLEMAARKLQHSLGRLRQLSFTSLLREDEVDKRAAVVYFLAMLELARRRSITVRQRAPFDEIIVTAGSNGAITEDDASLMDGAANGARAG